jgi:NifU-like protein involved in Fe-S cluster formation
MTVTLEQLYSPEILALAAGITHNQFPAAADITVRLRSTVCGSSIRIGVCFDADTRIIGYGHDVNACALGQASAALVARKCVGLDRTMLNRVMEQISVTIKTAVPDRLMWPEIKIFEPLQAYPQRHDAVLLPYRALALAFDQAGF